jgi:hypothetical protein
MKTINTNAQSRDKIYNYYQNSNLEPTSNLSYTEKQLQNVKTSIAPPSILDEIKKEVSEYSFS